MVNPIYTNGVIAVREKLLLGEKLLRYTEMTAEEVLRALCEGGFGSGAEGQEGEAIILAEEHALDSFIREYAPSQTELEYLLSPRDFHNAKALCKAKKLNTYAENMLAPEGLVKIDDLSVAIDSGDVSALNKCLGGAIKEALESEDLTGAEMGGIFDIALYKHLSTKCKFGPLKKLLEGKADRLNILTAMRSKNSEFAQKLYVSGGKLNTSKLFELFDEDKERAAKVLNGTPYAEFYKLCLEAKEKGLPFTEAERALESFEAEYFVERRFELEGKQPFMYYVFRRRAEIQNVRIILVCLNAGLSANSIKKRLRAI